MYRVLIAAGIAAALFGCATQPQVQMVWMRADAQRISGNPALQQQLELDKIACNGEMQKAGLSGTQFCRGLADCMVASSIRGGQMESVGKGCMADRGYLFVSADEAEARFAAMRPPPPPATPIPQQKGRSKAASIAPRPAVTAAPPAAVTIVEPVSYAPPEPQLSEADRTMNSRN
jgi:hypothetical protein